MKTTKLSTKISKLTGRTGLVLKKHSPEILLAIGITGTVASAVMACRATLHVHNVLENHNEKIAKINKAWAMVETGELDLNEYSEHDKKKDLTVAYTQTVVDFVTLYGPAVLLGTASIACILGGHRILKKRNVAITAAFKALQEGFTAYRNRVIEEHGEETDYMYKNGLRSEVVTKTEIDEDGKSVKTKKTKLVSPDGNTPSIYARVFAKGETTEWSPTPEYNYMKLRAEQNYANDLLRTRGHVFLNEVYDALGLERSQAGAAVGWVYDGDGDSYIDFGIFDENGQIKRDFVSKDDHSVLLDFNVDGVIWDSI